MQNTLNYSADAESTCFYGDKIIIIIRLIEKFVVKRKNKSKLSQPARL